jgi:hypothetical protein
MQSGTKKEILMEVWKGIVMTISLALAATISFYLYEQRLFEQKAKVDALTKEQQVKYEIANQALEVANEILLSGITLNFVGERARYFKELDPNIESIGYFLKMFTDMLEESGAKSPKEWGPKATTIMIKAKIILDEDVYIALYRLSESVTKSFKKYPQILDRASYLGDKISKQGTLAGTDLLMAENTISALINVFSVDEKELNEKYSNLLRLLIDRGYLGGSMTKKKDLNNPTDTPKL